MCSIPAQIIAAPMAGGPSTPELVRAVHRAGGFGFLASGNQSVSDLLADMRQLAGVPYGLNFFAPQPHLPSLEDVATVLDTLRSQYPGTGLKIPEDYRELAQPEDEVIAAVDLSNQFADKLAAACAAIRAGYGPQVLSMSFGCWGAAEVEQLHALGVQVWNSVTSVPEAIAAEQVGCDALIVQGHEAGGHRLTFDMTQAPNTLSTAELLVQVGEHTSLPLIAAGGVRTAADVHKLLAHPQVVAVQVGSLFLRCPEAGTSLRNRDILARPTLQTAASRAFSGRVARGVVSEFHRGLPQLPPLYPVLRGLCANIDPDYCLVGQPATGLPTTSAVEVVRMLLHNIGAIGDCS